ncbi:MAG: ABC transporter permease [Tissierellales bacterium]|jgi:ABC-type transport system involved in multi-copper enzyme maturation permease subunit|nr:ABC transporter permease [Tissierellales bacterium]
MINPVLKKEIKVRARNWKNAGMITLYALVLVFAAVVVFKTAEFDFGYRGGFSPEVLQGLYITCAIIQIFLIGLLVPATTASAISGEKQRRTFDLLICNRASNRTIILGKLMASLLQTFMLLILALPILSCLFMFGGISVTNLFKLTIFFMVTSVLLGSIGLFCSTQFKSTVPSIVVSYVIIFILSFGMLILIAIGYELFDFNEFKNLHAVFLIFNPGTGLSAILSEQMGSSFNFINAITDLDWSANFTLVMNLFAELILSGFFIWAATKNINPFKNRGRIK